MAPSASKQKRLAEKAAKKSAGGEGSTSGTPNTGSLNGSSANTPLTSMSAATSTEDLPSMAKLSLATDRCVCSPSHCPDFHANTAGAQLVSSYRMSRPAISRSIRTPCPSTVACSLRTLRSR